MKNQGRENCFPRATTEEGSQPIDEPQYKKVNMKPEPMKTDHDCFREQDDTDSIVDDSNEASQDVKESSQNESESNEHYLSDLTDRTLRIKDPTTGKLQLPTLKIVSGKFRGKGVPTPPPFSAEEIDCPTGGEWSIGVLHIDSQKSSCLGLTVRKEMIKRGIFGLVRGDILIVQVIARDQSVCFLIEGRASRKAAIYIRKDQLKEHGWKAHDSIYYTIIDIKNQEGISVLAARTKEGLATTT